MRDRQSPEQRLERLFGDHYAVVLAYGLRRAPRDVAEEVANAVFTVAWRRLDDVPSDPLPWLLGVARRTLANEYRATRRAQVLTNRIAEFEPRAPAAHQEPVESTQLDGELRAALLALPHLDREAILLVAWEGLTPAQAARVVGCSRTAMRLRLHRARRRLTAVCEPVHRATSDHDIGSSADPRPRPTARSAR